jgi:hypothetical protein
MSGPSKSLQRRLIDEAKEAKVSPRLVNSLACDGLTWSEFRKLLSETKKLDRDVSYSNGRIKDGPKDEGRGSTSTNKLSASNYANLANQFKVKVIGDTDSQLRFLGAKNGYRYYKFESAGGLGSSTAITISINTNSGRITAKDNLFRSYAGGITKNQKFVYGQRTDKNQ